MIKNIIFDIDGVLTNLDRCFYNFIKSSYEEYKGLTFEKMPEIFPIEQDDGALELPLPYSTDFYHSPFYCDRPLFEDTLNVLHSLKKKGIRLFTLSGAGDPVKKRKWLEGLFVDVFEAFEFSPAGVPKDNALAEVIKKYSLNKNETIFIDDRFYNLKAGLKTGITTVRMEPKFHLPLPQELKHIKVLTSLTEFETYIDELNSQS